MIFDILHIHYYTTYSMSERKNHILKDPDGVLGWTALSVSELEQIQATTGCTVVASGVSVDAAEAFIRKNPTVRARFNRALLDATSPDGHLDEGVPSLELGTIEGVFPEATEKHRSAN